VNERTAGICIEWIQGEGGVVPIDTAFSRRARELADQHDALLCFDEIQCGLGRTGHFFAYENIGVVPDMLTLAKPLAGGLPMGAVLVSEEIAATIQPGDWVQTDEGEVGKIASVDATSRTAAILKLDKESLRITSVPFPIDRMVKIQR